MRQSFYGKIYAASYDTGDSGREAFLPFYLQQWQFVDRQTPVLEPMCGTGLNLLPFLEAGAEIDGLDASPYMLAECHKKITAQGFKVNLYQQFLEEMTLPRQYGFMFISDRAFGHIHDKAVAQTSLTKLWEHLLPGGWLVFDVRPPAHRNAFPKVGHTEFNVEDRPDGVTIFTTSVWGDREDGRVLRCWNKHEQYVNGKLIETEAFDYYERFYERAELMALLQVAGFNEVKVMKAWDADLEPTANDGMVFACRKPEGTK